MGNSVDDTFAFVAYTLVAFVLAVFAIRLSLKHSDKSGFVILPCICGVLLYENMVIAMAVDNESGFVNAALRGRFAVQAFLVPLFLIAQFELNYEVHKRRSANFFGCIKFDEGHRKKREGCCPQFVRYSVWILCFFVIMLAIIVNAKYISTPEEATLERRPRFLSEGADFHSSNLDDVIDFFPFLVLAAFTLYTGLSLWRYGSSISTDVRATLCNPWATIVGADCLLTLGWVLTPLEWDNPYLVNGGELLLCAALIQTADLIHRNLEQLQDWSANIESTNKTRRRAERQKRRSRQSITEHGTDGSLFPPGPPSMHGGPANGYASMHSSGATLASRYSNPSRGTIPHGISHASRVSHGSIPSRSSSRRDRQHGGGHHGHHAHPNDHNNHNHNHGHPPRPHPPVHAAVVSAAETTAQPVYAGQVGSPPAAVPPQFPAAAHPAALSPSVVSPHTAAASPVPGSPAGTTSVASAGVGVPSSHPTHPELTLRVDFDDSPPAGDDPLRAQLDDVDDVRTLPIWVRPGQEIHIPSPMAAGARRGRGIDASSEDDDRFEADSPDESESDKGDGPPAWLRAESRRQAAGGLAPLWRDGGQADRHDDAPKGPVLDDLSVITDDDTLGSRSRRASLADPADVPVHVDGVPATLSPTTSSPATTASTSHHHHHQPTSPLPPASWSTVGQGQPTAHRHNHHHNHHRAGSPMTGSADEAAGRRLRRAGSPSHVAVGRSRAAGAAPPPHSRARAPPHLRRGAGGTSATSSPVAPRTTSGSSRHSAGVRSPNTSSVKSPKSPSRRTPKATTPSQRRLPPHLRR